MRARGAIRGLSPHGPMLRGLWTQIGRTLDANIRSFASKNKSLSCNYLTSGSMVFGRFGRKFPEQLFREGVIRR